ncbi:hypothetical protein AAMO2058_001619200 [Amorphochlora amoebiformis]|mmetsp:Transcript_8443/g.13232  ORF Transcript_8443/g.13232 Transcript_8443/m.13232 type:complete len:198 (-) Transcript_8443:207-800(-)
MSAPKQTLLLVALGCILGIVAFSAAGLRSSSTPKLGSASFRSAMRTRAFQNPVSSQMDFRRAMFASKGSKCVPVNNMATLCGKMVVLRKPTAVRAAEKETTLDADKIIDDVTSKLNKIENKGQVAIYAGASVLAVLVANGLVTTIDAIPVLPYFMKLIGTGYTSWFIYRYLLFDDSRKELLEDLEAIRKKVTGEATD